MSKKDKHALFNKANEAWEAGRNKEAFELFRECAKNGDVYAYNTIGYFYDLGIGVKKNKAKALSWYKKGARQGDLLTYSNIGSIYRDLGNSERAKFWFLKAFESGDGDAALELAKLYLRKNSNKNLISASRYLKLVIKSKKSTQDSAEEAKKILYRLKLKKCK